MFLKEFIILKYEVHENRVFVVFAAISLLAKDLKRCSSIDFIMKKADILFTL